MCSLSKELQYLCKFGCIFRDEAFRHLACEKRKGFCVAPCFENIKKDVKLYEVNEVSKMQKEIPPRVQVRMWRNLLR
jgi:hypothetical protein